MADFILQSVNPGGAIVNAINVPLDDLIEAHALARRFAASLVEAAPDGKSWSGWSVELLDPFGRYALSVPLLSSSPTTLTDSFPDMTP